MTKPRAQARATTLETQCANCGSVLMPGLRFKDAINGEQVCSSCFNNWLSSGEAVVTEIIQGDKVN